MAKDVHRELQQLKKDYFDLEEKSREEKESLQKVISVFSVLASSREDVADDVKEMKELINEIAKDRIAQFKKPQEKTICLL